MPDVAEQPPQPTDRRGRRIYVWWAVALTLLALLGAFCSAVVVPWWQVRREVLTVRPRVPVLGEIPPISLHDPWDPWMPDPAVHELGGPSNAVSKLALYLRMPDMLAPRKDRATRALGSCRPDKSVPLLERLLMEKDPQIRQAAARAIQQVQRMRWIGYPKGSPDWAYRYVFDSSEMKSGWVEYQSDGQWFMSGPLRNITRDKNTVRCEGPIRCEGARGVPVKLLYVGAEFEILEDSGDSSVVRMICDYFDSTFVVLVFRNEDHGDAPRAREQEQKP